MSLLEFWGENAPGASYGVYDKPGHWKIHSGDYSNQEETRGRGSVLGMETCREESRLTSETTVSSPYSGLPDSFSAGTENQSDHTPWPGSSLSSASPPARTMNWASSLRRHRN